MAKKKFPMRLGFKFPKVKMKGNSTIYCTFDPDFRYTSENTYTFLYDFKEGLLLKANDVTNIHIPHPELYFMGSIYGMHTEGWESSITFHGGETTGHEGISDKELENIESTFGSSKFKSLCEAVLTVMG